MVSVSGIVGEAVAAATAGSCEGTVVVGELGEVVVVVGVGSVVVVVVGMDGGATVVVDTELRAFLEPCAELEPVIDANEKARKIASPAIIFGTCPDRIIPRVPQHREQRERIGS
jgi:hypothetical protein